jgi:protein-disulfide isomerase
MRSLSRRLALAATLAAGLLGPAAYQVARAQTPAPADMTLGNAKAKVTVVEYASTACPHCAHWNAEVWPAFKAKYVDTGKVNFVFRELITSPPQVAVAGPLLARCAGKDKYFAVIDGAFRAQDEIYQTSTLMPLVKVAQANGLNEDQVKACLSDEAAVTAIQERVEANAKRDGVSASPTFLVNGAKLEGAQSLEELDKAIAAAGKGKRPKS